MYNKTEMKIIFFTDYGVLPRHIQVDTILGALEIEKEAFQKAQLFSWIFFPIWIIMAIVQAVRSKNKSSNNSISPTGDKNDITAIKICISQGPCISIPVNVQRK